MSDLLSESSSTTEERDSSSDEYPMIVIHQIPTTAQGFSSYADSIHNTYNMFETVNMFTNSLLHNGFNIEPNTYTPEVIYNIFDYITALENDIENAEKISKEFVLNIPETTYEQTSKLHATCVICTENFNSDDNVTELSCKHIYHPDCIRKWGKIQQKCPLCNIEIPVIDTQNA